MDGPHTRTLKRALELVGSKEGLALTLQLTLQELEAYLQGETLVPHKVFRYRLPWPSIHAGKHVLKRRACGLAGRRIPKAKH